MNTNEFEASLKRDGYLEIETKTVSANTASKPHAHEFSVRALVLAGDVTLTYEGQSRTFRAGDIFEMAAGCVHFEKYGLDGATSLVGCKR
jgi:quercetin dioxygenase-like cupin family protein